MENIFLDYEFKFHKKLCEFAKSQKNEDLKKLIKNELEGKIRMYQELELIEFQFPQCQEIAEKRRETIKYLQSLLKKL
jgi:hypothetical protein